METAFLASPSSSSFNLKRKYDVFLNFSSVDTRKNFMGHLKSSLCKKGIETFIYDDQRLERGKSISPQLLQAIEDSSCSVVILSPNYASSTWCLDELVKILDCMKTKGQIVIPIFYHVEPSDVRKQTGNFGVAFAKHEENLKDNVEKVKAWRDALTEVASLAGLDLQNYRDEAKFITDIVGEVSRNVPSLVSTNNSEEQGFGKNPILKILYAWISTAFSFIRAMSLIFLCLIIVTVFIVKVLIPLISLFIPIEDY